MRPKEPPPGGGHVLLHICCAPDASHGVPAMQERSRVTGFFFNPNIQPGEEYDRRLAATRELAGPVPFPLEVARGGEGEWEEAVRGLEAEPERGKRCEACIRMRLARTASEAKSLGIPAFSTVLTVSPKKDAAMVNRIGREEGEKAGVFFLEADLKKRDGFRKSVETAKRLGIYRQNYCGCRYSIKRGGSVRESNPPETLLPPDRI
jgi:predicted adenine nucleotide alpha hydrolase (AANH) superfamily ATPase